MHEEISHTLRTPLTSIIGFTSTLLDQWHDLAEEQRVEFLRIVHAEALRMSHSVEAIDRRLYFQLAPAPSCSSCLKTHVRIADAC